MPVQASEELTRQVEEARALVAILQAALEEVEDNPEVIDWGHVGTMSEVLSTIREVVKQINALT